MSTQSLICLIPSVVVQNLLKAHQWVTLLHWQTCSFIYALHKLWSWSSCQLPHNTQEEEVPGRKPHSPIWEYIWLVDKSKCVMMKSDGNICGIQLKESWNISSFKASTNKSFPSNTWDTNTKTKTKLKLLYLVTWL